MTELDYLTELDKIYEFEIEINSLGDCRRVMATLNEQEDILKKIKRSVKYDIRLVESSYLKKRAYIRDKYTDKQVGLLDSLGGPFSSSRVKEMKKLDNDRNNNLEFFYEIKFTTENLLIQTEELRDNVQQIMRELLGNY
ncbi:MAG: hypothetical protein LUQ24_03000 [Methanobacterium sp.]|jgi:hypothetical protein|nr:hypothetical protein [Methanobacterium sp.]